MPPLLKPGRHRGGEQLTERAHRDAPAAAELDVRQFPSVHERVELAPSVAREFGCAFEGAPPPRTHQIQKDLDSEASATVLIDVPAMLASSLGRFCYRFHLSERILL